MENNYFKKTKIEQFTRQEFLEFLIALGDPTGRTETEDSRWIRHFRSLAQHPKGSDILFYPEPGKDSPEAIIEEVERYRRQKGLPGFKDSDF